MSKNASINFKISGEERRVIEQIAKAKGENLSVVTRMLIRQAIASNEGIVKGVANEKQS